MHGIELNQTERNIIEALGDTTLRLEELAPKAGYEVSGHLRRTVSSLTKRGILGNKKPGYFVQPEYQRMIERVARVGGPESVPRTSSGKPSC